MENPERFTNEEWQAPPPPEGLPTETGETMTLAQTLTGIFFEPARTFASLRLRPRFLVAAVIILLSFAAFQIALIQKLGYDNIIRQQISNNPQVEQMQPEQKRTMIEFYNGAIGKTVIYASPIVGVVLVFVFGALIYWGAAAAFGGSSGFARSLALLAYAWLPVAAIAMLLNFVVLLLKNADDIDLAASRGGLARANLGVLIDAKAQPLLATALGSVDLIQFYGVFLVAVGFQKIAKLSAGSAWTIAITLWLIGVAFRLIGTAFSGAAM